MLMSQSVFSAEGFLVHGRFLKYLHTFITVPAPRAQKNLFTNSTSEQC